MLKVVIFDMDGVIVDTKPVHAKIGEIIFSSLGISVPYELQNSFIGVRTDLMWQDLKDKYKLRQSVSELTEISKNKCFDYFHYLLSEKKINLIPGVIKLIKDLYKNNTILAVASSSSIKIINLVLDHFNIGSYFVKKISGYDVARSKPFPDIFIYTAQSINILPEYCVVIEDSKNGIIAAKSLNMKCIGYNNLNSERQDLSKSDLLIKSFLKFGYIKLRKFYDSYAR